MKLSGQNASTNICIIPNSCVYYAKVFQRGKDGTAEETRLKCLVNCYGQVFYDVSLTIEDSTIVMVWIPLCQGAIVCIATDGSEVGHATHVDVSRQAGVGIRLATIHTITKSN